MDPSVFFAIPPNVLQSVFGWDMPKMSGELKQLLQSVSLKEAKTSADTHQLFFEDMFAHICEFLFEHLTNQYPYTLIKNPFSNWKRLPHRNMFELGRNRRSIPDFALKFKYPTTKQGQKPLYIVNGYDNSGGAYAQVKPFVIWNNNICVLKKIKVERQPEFTSDKSMIDRHTSDMYELVIQTYLHSYCTASHITIPKLYFVQRQGNNTHACMERLSGIFVCELEGDELLIAIAHVMKALYVLQRDFRFLHRDFHGSNVCFDRSTYNVGIIDFGMACVNPNRADIAWQSNNTWFFPVVQHSQTAQCQNCSLDVCMLVASVADKHILLSTEHTNMKNEMQGILETSDSFAKKEMEEDYEMQYTKIYKHQPWKVGNLLRKTDEKHWWVYNTAEFEMIRWDPRSMLSRLLYQIPIIEWFPLRHEFPDFDSVVPKNLNVQHISGVRGILSHISNNLIYIRHLDGTISSHTDALITDSPTRLTIGQEIVIQKDGNECRAIVINTRMASDNNLIDIITIGEKWQQTVVQLHEILQFD